MRKVLGWLLLTLLMRTIDNQLIRSPNIYKEVIREVCDYYQCFSITLFHSSPSWTQDIDVMTKLKNLVMYFESKLLIQTTVTDISSYAIQFSSMRFNLMTKSLFILLNDSDDMKVQFARMLIPLMDISKPMWMIFMQDKTSIEDFFEDVYIPFNCKFMISKKSLDIEDSEVITEIYRVYFGKQLKQDFFATWNTLTGMDPPSLPFFMRRKNLDSQLLRVSSINRPPGSIVIENKEENTTELGGSCGEILLDFQNFLNFRVSFKQSIRGGYCYSNGTCTDSVELMRTNQSDILALDLVVITSRIDKLQYLAPLLNIYISISKNVQWQKYLTPFSKGIWFIIAIMIILIGSFITLIKFLSKVKLIDKLDLDHDDDEISFIDSYLIVIAALSGQAMKQSQINSLRFIALTTHVTSIVLLASYSAVLISLLTVNHAEAPLKSIKDFLEDGSYSVGVMLASTEYAILEGIENSLIKQLLKKINQIKSTLPSTRREGLQRVCDDNKFAFVTNTNAYSKFDPENCYIVPLDNIVDLSAAFAVQKNSPYIDLFNY
ncbi:uncharacterized protein [Chelonus insularis]|uniref:uncharacterized protein n=1 Tax=Chelonus insularis TaxID=460826 RepID=UPI00158BFEF4|nr:uncharacterized protein LOC118071478 [Chelonus insularis]